MNWWENDYLKVKNQKLYLDEKEVREVAEKYGTPLFVYSKRQILSNFKRLIQAFSDETSLDLRIYYAMKANPNQGILRILRENGAYIDAVSPGEVDQALQAGFSRKKILYTGTSVSTEDLYQIFKQEDTIVNIDAEEQLRLMKETRDRWFEDKKKDNRSEKQFCFFVLQHGYTGPFSIQRKLTIAEKQHRDNQ